MVVTRAAGEYPQYEGMRAVQRCDNCRVFKDDTEAAKRAHLAGIWSRFKYPCILACELEPPAAFTWELWQDHPPIPHSSDAADFVVNPDRGVYCKLGSETVAVGSRTPEDCRQAIATQAIRGFKRRDELLAIKLKSLHKKDKEALLVKWERSFLGLLIAAWGAWSNGEAPYAAWMASRRKAITAKFQIYI